MTVGMFDSFITSHWFSASAKALWSDRATLQAWLDVEAALAAVQSELGLVPAEVAATIARHARAEHFDADALARGIAFAQHPLVPVLHQLEALCGEPAAGFVHLGATTQNIFDTATALQMRATQGLLEAQLQRATAAFAAIAQAHRDTPMAARTHGQHALPMSLGFKLAGWIEELERDRSRLVARLPQAFVASMGGAVGTFAAMGTAGREVERRLASRLGLQAAGLPSRASYDRPCDYITALGLLAATAQKIAQDVVFMQRTEVGEAAEAFHHGKVGSSTMAQKRNPSTALLLVSLARQLRGRVPLALEAMVRSDEGDSSCTNVTDTLMPELAILAVSVAERLTDLAQGLVIDAQAMRRNLGLTRGLIVSEAVMMRLAPRLGRHHAHRLLYEAAQHAQVHGQSLQVALAEVAAADAAASPAGVEAPRVAELMRELDDAFEPTRYLGASLALTDETLERLQRRRVATDAP